MEKTNNTKSYFHVHVQWVFPLFWLSKQDHPEIFIDLEMNSKWIVMHVLFKLFHEELLNNAYRK